MKSSRDATYLPLILLALFYSTTLLMFLSDFLIEYPSRNTLALLVLLVSSWSMMGLGFHAASRFPHRRYPDLPLGPLADAGLLALLILFIPSVLAYTGQPLEAAAHLLLHPAEAHAQMVETVEQSRDARLKVLVAKLIVAPLTILCIPWFAYRILKRDRQLGDWIRFGAVCIFVLGLSIYRGTDKEVFDLLILAGATALIVVAQRLRLGWRIPVRRVLLICLLLGATSVAIFGFRKGDRLGVRDTRCFSPAPVCFSLSFDSRSPTLFSKTVVTLWGYATQGYYGLSVALDADFESAYGFGHSRPLRFLAGKFGFDPPTTITDQLPQLGWHDRALWSSALAWLANDIPFGAIPLLLAVVAGFAALSWKAAVRGSHRLSVVIFAYTFYLLIYLPANLTLAQTGDIYLAYLFWMGVFTLLLIYSYSTRVRYLIDHVRRAARQLTTQRSSRAPDENSLIDLSLIGLFSRNQSTESRSSTPRTNEEDSSHRKEKRDEF